MIDKGESSLTSNRSSLNPALLWVPGRKVLGSWSSDSSVYIQLSRYFSTCATFSYIFLFKEVVDNYLFYPSPLWTLSIHTYIHITYKSRKYGRAYLCTGVIRFQRSHILLIKVSLGLWPRTRRDPAQNMVPYPPSWGN